MNKNEKIEERKQWNKRFLAAFDFLAKKMEVTQGRLAEMLESNGSLISAYKSGVKRASEDIMQRLVDASDGELNINYMLWLSDYMLSKNVPIQESKEIKNRKYNPDYDLIKEREKVTVDEMSDRDKYMHALESQIADLRCQLVDKANIIESKDQIIKNLENEIAKLNLELQKQGITDYMFPIGVADNKEYDSTHV